jgi:hypothetical protein
LASVTASGFVILKFAPFDLVKWLVVGCAADYCLRTVAQSYGDFFGLGTKSVAQSTSP